MIKEILFFIVAGIMFLLGAIIVISFTLRTLNLFSFQSKEYLITGACKDFVYLLDGQGKESMQEGGFLTKSFDETSIRDIPKQTVLLVDGRGEIKGSVDDLGLISSLMMLAMALLCVFGGLYLSALLKGVDGGSFFENLAILAKADKWIWVRYVSGTIILFVWTQVIVSSFFVMKFNFGAKKNPRLYVSKRVVSPGNVYPGELQDKYTQDVYLQRHNKSVLVRKWCVKFSNIYHFPIYLTYVDNAQTNDAKRQPSVGDTVNMKVSSDYRLEIN